MNKKLWEEKERLLVKRGLSLGLQFQVPIPTFTDSDLATQLERLVKTSRILHLDEKELYFVEDADDGPFSTINELESLYTIWSLIECLKSDAKPQGEKVLQFLQELTSDKINALCPEYPDKETFKEEAEDGKELLKWGKANGMTADKLNITRCSETGKGVEASEDIEIGEIVLEVPDFLIIDENTVKKSETYKTLMGKDISSEEMLLLWCMMERRNPGPKFKVYFESLPHKFYTGLSFGEKAEIEIGATYLGCELQEILKHLSKRFRDLCSKIIIPSEYKLEDYMWARQLLDTNGMRILASDGTSRLCLVPVAGFFNHSFCPHVLRYELRHEMDHTTIIFRASRPCKKGEQCFISYGNLSGCDLVKSYGFLPLGYNLYDVITLDLGKFVDGIDIIQRNDGFSWPTAMLRTIPYSKSRILPTRLVVALSASLANAIGDNSDDIVQQECQVVELRLPVDRFKMNKELWEEKERLLVKKGLSLSLQLQVPIPTFTDSDLATQLERLVKTSRILHLDEKELYFVEDADDGPFSTINELESLYTIWSLIECLKSDAKPQGEKVLQFLQELTSDKINALCPEYPDKDTFKEEAEDGKELLKWGKANGMRADKLNITL